MDTTQFKVQGFVCNARASCRIVRDSHNGLYGVSSLRYAKLLGSKHFVPKGP